MKRLLSYMLTLVMVIGMSITLHDTVHAVTVTTKEVPDLLKAPNVKSGTTTVKLKAGSKNGYRDIAFTAPKKGTYKITISNVKVKGVNNSDLWFFTDSGKYTEMFFKYDDKDVTIRGEKTNKIRAMSRAYFKHIAASSDKSVFAEPARNNIEEVNMYYNPTFTVKLDKGEVFLLRCMYVTDHDSKDDINGEAVGNAASYKIKIKGVNI